MAVATAELNMVLGEENKMKPRVVVILGPTATGKSNCGIKLALRLKTEILSGDSMLVYKNMNIGTIIGLLIAVGTAIKDNLPDDEK